MRVVLPQITENQEWPCHDVSMPIEIGDVCGTTRNAGAGKVVFASPAPFAVGSAISFVITTPAETTALLRFACSGTVINAQEVPNGGFETAATIDSIRIIP